MSVSFCWEVVKPETARTFAAGTSNDVETLKNTFGDTVSDQDIRTLRAMDLAAGRHKTLWGEIADTVERISEGSDKPTKLRIWTEY